MRRERRVDFFAERLPGCFAAFHDFACGFREDVVVGKPVGVGFRVPGFAVDGVRVLLPSKTLTRRYNGQSVCKHVHPLQGWMGSSVLVPCSVIDERWLSWKRHVVIARFGFKTDSTFSNYYSKVCISTS